MSPVWRLTSFHAVTKRLGTLTRQDRFGEPPRCFVCDRLREAFRSRLIALSRGTERGAAVRSLLTKPVGHGDTPQVFAS